MFSLRETGKNNQLDKMGSPNYKLVYQPIELYILHKFELTKVYFNLGMGHDCMFKQLANMLGNDTIWSCCLINLFWS